MPGLFSFTYWNRGLHGPPVWFFFLLRTSRYFSSCIRVHTSYAIRKKYRDNTYLIHVLGPQWSKVLIWDRYSTLSSPCCCWPSLSEISVGFLTCRLMERRGTLLCWQSLTITWANDTFDHVPLGKLFLLPPFLTHSHCILLLMSPSNHSFQKHFQMSHTSYKSLFDAKILFWDETKSLDQLINLFHSIHSELGPVVDDINLLENCYEYSQQCNMPTTLHPREVYQISCGLLHLTLASLSLQCLLFQEAPGFEPLDILVGDTPSRINITLESQLEKYQQAKKSDENSEVLSNVCIVTSFLEAIFPEWVKSNVVLSTLTICIIS